MWYSCSYCIHVQRIISLVCPHVLTTTTWDSHRCRQKNTLILLMAPIVLLWTTSSIKYILHSTHTALMSDFLSICVMEIYLLSDRNMCVTAKEKILDTHFTTGEVCLLARTEKEIQMPFVIQWTNHNMYIFLIRMMYLCCLHLNIDMLKSDQFNRKRQK